MVNNSIEEKKGKEGKKGSVTSARCSRPGISACQASTLESPRTRVGACRSNGSTVVGATIRARGAVVDGCAEKEVEKDDFFCVEEEGGGGEEERRKKKEERRKKKEEED